MRTEHLLGPEIEVEGTALGTLDGPADGPAVGDEERATVRSLREELDGTSLGLVRCDDRGLNRWAFR